MHNACNTDLAAHTTRRTTPAPDPHQSALRRMCHLFSAGLPPQCLIKQQFGAGSVSTPASCPNRSCPVRAVRFASWSNSSSWIASNTASGAASRCQIFISSDGERAGAIASALVGSPTCSSICHTVAGSVTFLQMLFGYRSYEELHYAVPDCWCDVEDVRVLLTALFPKNNIGNISGRVNANLFGAH